jgi:predicted enzyme related to lactoylglutathione lyase
VGNPVVQWQIVARDPQAVAAFYTKVFGWSVRTDNALGFRVVETGDDRGIDGGIWPSPPEGHNLVQLFIQVEDIDAMIASATAAGAQVLFPKQHLPDGDAMAILLDPAGLSFGIYTPASRAST